MPESFAAFMARALHDPQHGYYARRIQDIGGQRGDFATAATLSPQLGQAIAVWLHKCHRAQPHVRHVIEVGAGNGMLMQTVRRSLSWWQRRGFHWHIVETSASLRTQQMKRLGSSNTWHQSLEAALATCSGMAFIYHNELLDAFPVRLVQYKQGAWHEIFLQFENGHARELLLPLELRPMLGSQLDTSFSALSNPPQHATQRCELHESVRDWLRRWVPNWKAGEMLTVDYGDTFPTLYHRRPHGTLRAYLLHQRLEGTSIYENAGRQDITADVNFTDYRSWAEQLGLREVSYLTQAAFLHSHVPVASGAMVDPTGAGGAFKVVIHQPS
jgi:SAM-dependent MidA family methyltransferase